MKTLKGIDLAEALKTLAEPREPRKDKQGHGYFEIEEYAQEMNRVFGRDGYTVSYTEMPAVTFPTGQIILQAKAHISILGADGEIFSSEGMGSFEIMRVKETGMYQNLSTCAMNAQVNAFKAACRDLGIFGCRLVGNDSKKGGSSNGSGTNRYQNQNSNKPSAALKTILVHAKDPLAEFWKDRDGKPAFRMVGIADGKKVEVLFYPNQYAASNEKLNELILRLNNTQKGFNVTLSVTECAPEKCNKDYEGSYVFKKFGGVA